MPSADTVAAVGTLPLPALIIFGIVTGVLGALFIWVKFGEGRKKLPAAEEFQVRLATFDPRHIEVLVQELQRNTEAQEDQCRCVQELGRDVRELARVARALEKR